MGAEAELAVLNSLESRQLLSVAWSIGWDFPSSDGEGAGLHVSIGNGREARRGRGSRPEVRILEPDEGHSYRAGQAIRFAGNATDGEDGSLLPGRFRWRAVLFVEREAVRRVARIRGFRAGAFELPENLPSNPDQFVRLSLVVRDSDGNRARRSVELRPTTSQLSIGTNFPDEALALKVNGHTRRTPHVLDSVESSRITLAAPRRQRVDGVRYRFVRWSDGGERAHRIEAPIADGVLTAIYRIVDVRRDQRGGGFSTKRIAG